MTAWRLTEATEESATRWDKDGEYVGWIKTGGNVEDVVWDWTDTTTVWTDL